MKFLADVNVLSEPTKLYPAPQVSHWLRENQREIVVDPIILGEIWEGIIALPAGRRRVNLEDWFHAMPAGLVCLPWTQNTAIAWAEIRDSVRRSGFTVPVKDTLIAATAKLHGLSVATRNVDDFTRCGVGVVNPFD
jgi:predicted nucleic acid-binding protein